MPGVPPMPSPLPPHIITVRAHTPSSVAPQLPGCCQACERKVECVAHQWERHMQHPLSQDCATCQLAVHRPSLLLPTQQY